MPHGQSTQPLGALLDHHFSAGTQQWCSEEGLSASWLQGSAEPGSGEGMFPRASKTSLSQRGAQREPADADQCPAKAVPPGKRTACPAPKHRSPGRRQDAAHILLPLLMVFYLHRPSASSSSPAPSQTPAQPFSMTLPVPVFHRQTPRRAVSTSEWAASPSPWRRRGQHSGTRAAA